MPPSAQPDPVLSAIASYVLAPAPAGRDAVDTARLCLADSLGCAMLALGHAECTRLLGPLVPETVVPNGATVPGTDHFLDPVKAAFDLGSMIRWLDFNDTWLAAEWGHPSDNLGGILAVADFVSRRNALEQKPSLKVGDVLGALIQAYEIQGVLALENSFNRAGLDHVILVRVATAAVTARLLGGTPAQVINAISNAWADGGSLRVYRHAPNTGSRKSWAAGDATARGVWHAMMAMRGEMGYPTVLTTPTWGFGDALLRGKPIVLPRTLGSYVMENILFKVSFPAEFHAQTAVECAFVLHSKVKDHIDQVESVTIHTQEPAMRIIDKKGPLKNPADRDHCLQYMVAVALLNGSLSAEHYADEFAKDPRIDLLREKMSVVEDRAFSRDYLDPEKRSIANAIQIRLKDGTSTEKVVVEYPLGHRRRRAEALPQLREKLVTNLQSVFSANETNHIVQLFDTPRKLDSTPVDQFMDLLCPKT